MAEVVSVCVVLFLNFQQPAKRPSLLSRLFGSHKKSFEYFTVSFDRRSGNGKKIGIKLQAVEVTWHHEILSSCMQGSSHGIVVSAIEPDGLASDSGQLSVGDVVISINGIMMKKATDEQVRNACTAA